MSTVRENVSAVSVSAPDLLALEKSKLACRFVNEEVIFAFPGNNVRLPEKLIELVTVVPFKTKLSTLKTGELKEANEPIDMVVPVGAKLRFVSENPFWVRLNAPNEKASKPVRRLEVTVASVTVAMVD